MRGKIIYSFLAVLFLIITGFVLNKTYQLSETAIEIVAEGDRLVGLNRPKRALIKYEEASQTFPLIKFTSSYKRRVAYANAAIDAYKDQPSVVVYFGENARESDIEGLVVEVEKNDGYVDSIFVSKSEALDLYKQKITGDMADNLFDNISEDDIMSYLEVYLADSTYTNEVLEVCRGKDYVFDVVDVSK